MKFWTLSAAFVLAATVTRAEVAPTFDCLKLKTPLGFSGGETGLGTGDVSGLSVKAKGATTSRTNANRAGDALAPQDFGAKGDGVSDDTTALLAWGASRKAGSCPQGTYLTTKTVVILPKDQWRGQSWRFDANCRIKLTAPAKAVVQFGAGDDWPNIIRDGVIEGGNIDANFLAPVAVDLPFYNNLVVNGMQARNALARYYKLGDANALRSSYGIVFSSLTQRDAPYISMSAVSQANPAVVTSALPHNLVAGQQLWIANATGMTGINSPSWFTVGSIIDATHFTLANVDTSAMPAYTGGGKFAPTVSGSVAPLVVSNVTNATTPTVTFTSPHNLKAGQKIRILSTPAMASLEGYHVVATVVNPYNITLSDIDTTSLNTWYGVSAAAAISEPVAITDISNAARAVVTTSAAHGFAGGQKIFIDGVVGFGGAIYGFYDVTAIDATHFSIAVDTSLLPAYSARGEVYPYPGVPLTAVFEENASNTTIANAPSIRGVAVGYDGITSGVHPYTSQITSFHVWNPQPDGIIQSCLVFGGENMITTSLCDGPWFYGFRIWGQNNSIIGNDVNNLDTWGLPNASIGVRFETGSGASIVNLGVFGSGTLPILADFNGDFANARIIGRNTKYVAHSASSVYPSNNGNTAQFVFNAGSTNGYVVVYPSSSFTISTNKDMSLRTGASYTEALRIDAAGHFGHPSATTPTVSSCGTAPGSASGGDAAGSVTEGTSATGCVITFAAAYSAVPYCTANLSTANAVGLSATKTAMIVTHALLSGAKLTWRCVGN